MKFEVKVVIETAEQDVDLGETFGELLRHRFSGGAIKVLEATVWPIPPEPTRP